MCQGPASCRMLFTFDDVREISPPGHHMSSVLTRKWQERIKSARLIILVGDVIAFHVTVRDVNTLKPGQNGPHFPGDTIVVKMEVTYHLCPRWLSYFYGRKTSLLILLLILNDILIKLNNERKHKKTQQPPPPPPHTQKKPPVPVRCELRKSNVNHYLDVCWQKKKCYHNFDQQRINKCIFFNENFDSKLVSNYTHFVKKYRLWQDGHFVQDSLRWYSFIWAQMWVELAGQMYSGELCNNLMSLPCWHCLVATCFAWYVMHCICVRANVAYSRDEYKLLVGGLYSNCYDYFWENVCMITWLL